MSVSSVDEESEAQLLSSLSKAALLDIGRTRVPDPVQVLLKPLLTLCNPDTWSFLMGQATV